MQSGELSEADAFGQRYTKVGRFGSQNAMVGRLDDLGAGGVSVCPVGHRNEEKKYFLLDLVANYLKLK